MQRQQQRVERRGASERRLSRQAFIQHCPQAENISGGSCLLRADLFGRHVARCADHRAAMGQAGIVARLLGEAEIAQTGFEIPEARRQR